MGRMIAVYLVLLRDVQMTQAPTEWQWHCSDAGGIALKNLSSGWHAFPVQRSVLLFLSAALITYL